MTSTKIDITTQEFEDLTSEEFEWEIARCLLEAHSKTGRALEQYLILQTIRTNRKKNNQTVMQMLEEAKVEHKQIIETIDLAKELIEKTEYYQK